VRFAEIDGFWCVTDAVGSVGSDEADVWRGWSGTVVQPTSVTMVVAVMMNTKRMGFPVALVDEAIGRNATTRGESDQEKGNLRRRKVSGTAG
jgi:hypothetical protein